MYCTPCARLMKSITPNTSVRPAATRNRRTPSCSPLRIWTARRVVDMSDPRRAVISVLGERAACAPRTRGISLHRTILGVRIGVVLEFLLVDLRLELRVLGFLDVN